MADSIEQKIMAAIVDRMELINGTGDYLTSIGTRVEDSRANWDQNELPAISVFEGRVETTYTDDEEVEVLRKMSVMIRCQFEADNASATTAAFARKSIADIKRAIRIDRHFRTDPDDPSTALAYMTREVAHSIEYVPDSFEIAGTQTEIEISYFATNFDQEN